MSKLAEHLTVTLNGEKFVPEMAPVPTMEVGMTIEDFSPSLGDIQTFSVGVKLSVTAAVNRETMAHNQFIIREMKRNIIEDVFGEFRKDFSTINLLLFNRDTEAAMKALDEFRTKMFEEGL